MFGSNLALTQLHKTGLFLLLILRMVRKIGMKTYSTADVDLVLEWSQKYFELNALINKVFGSENFKNPPCMPSFENEIEYQRLRFWFRKNHDKFVPIWADFCSSHGNSIEFIPNSYQMEYTKNPFLYYYGPDDLLDLADTMGATITADTQDSNKEAVELMLNITNRFSWTVINMAHWIGEFAESNNEIN